MANTEPRRLASLPAELFALVANTLDAQSLANLAVASSECQVATRVSLLAALLATVRRCLALKFGRMSDALVACPYFCLFGMINLRRVSGGCRPASGRCWCH